MSQAVLQETELHLIDAYWRAANYLSVGQVYLLDNPLLREPLSAEHVKPRLLGHFGTTPFMVEALENDELVREAPAIVGRQTASALAHGTGE